MKTVRYSTSDMLKCLNGSFEVEGISISETAKKDMVKLKNGKVKCEDLVRSICNKYRNEHSNV